MSDYQCQRCGEYHDPKEHDYVDTLSPTSKELDEILNEFETDTVTDMDAKLAYLKSELTRCIEAETVKALEQAIALRPDIIGNESGWNHAYQDGYNSSTEEYIHRLVKLKAELRQQLPEGEHNE